MFENNRWRMLCRRKKPIQATLSQGEDYLSSIDFVNALTQDDGHAAKQHLAAGRPIYYGDPLYPEGLIKKYPDGHRQIVAVDPDGKITVVRDL